MPKDRRSKILYYVTSGVLRTASNTKSVKIAQRWAEKLDKTHPNSRPWGVVREISVYEKVR